MARQRPIESAQTTMVLQPQAVLSGSLAHRGDDEWSSKWTSKRLSRGSARAWLTLIAWTRTFPQLTSMRHCTRCSVAARLWLTPPKRSRLRATGSARPAYGYSRPDQPMIRREGVHPVDAAHGPAAFSGAHVITCVGASCGHWPRAGHCVDWNNRTRHAESCQGHAADRHRQ